MIGERIRQLRLRQGLSISELANCAGVAKSYISKIERGIQHNPSMDFVCRVSSALSTDVRSLILSEEPLLDHEWIELLERAVTKGMTKEEFQRMLRSWSEFAHSTEGDNDRPT